MEGGEERGVHPNSHFVKGCRHAQLAARRAGANVCKKWPGRSVVVEEEERRGWGRCVCMCVGGEGRGGIMHPSSRAIKGSLQATLAARRRRVLTSLLLDVETQFGFIPLGQGLREASAVGPMATVLDCA